MGKGAYQGVKQMEILREFILQPGEPVYMPMMENGNSDSDTDPEDGTLHAVISMDAIEEFWAWREIHHPLGHDDSEFFDYWNERSPSASNNSDDSDYQPSDISSGGEHWSHEVLTDEEQEIIEISDDEREVIVISSDDEDSVYCTSENEVPQSPPWTVVKRRRLE
jgi:hypothetical protein